MRSKMFIVIVFVLALSFQGCSMFREGAKGAKEGFKKDWKALTETDSWMREHLW